MRLPEHIDKKSDPEIKIALFRSLFRGRDDVFPTRFESRKTGRSGYSPACANEWIRGLCDKRRVKCVDCPNRRFLPVTDEVIHMHLTGADTKGQSFVAGVYPMLLDESCFFLAMDFDKKNWQEDVAATRATCDEMELPCAVERSRSGNGSHLWLIFEEAVPAILARKLGAHLLTQTMERRPDIGLDSYDRFFPNQDTLPKGGLGNLIALPLQKAARAAGNSSFIDEHFAPYDDQWAFLASVQRIGRSKIEEVVHNAESQGNILGVRLVLDENDGTPWTKPPSRKRKDPPITAPLPGKLELVLGNEIYVEKEQLPPELRNRLIRLAAFQNPEFYKAQAMRLPTFDKPRIISCAENHAQHISLPRGCLDELKTLLKSFKIRVIIKDIRFAGEPVDVQFQGTLRPEQKAATDALQEHDAGVLSATTAFGKTVVAADMIAKRGVNTLILVHRRQLMEQWVERLAAFLDISAKSIGCIGGGRKKVTGKIDVALIQSMVRKGVVKDFVADYGHLIVDECHHLPAVSFEQVARQCKAKYVLGLSATVNRKDGHHPIVFMQCGPVRYAVSAKQQAARQDVAHSVIVRPTSFQDMEPEEQDQRMQFHALYQGLIIDAARNELICADVLEALRSGKKPILLTERREHIDLLVETLAPKVANLIVLQGGMGKRKLNEALAQLAAVPENEERLLIATGKFIGEGFDDARLDTLFLTLPVSWRGTIAQYVGRLHRQHDLKKEVWVYDYADLNVPMLSKMFDRRCKGYEAVGYSILLPASAIPGWPPEVPLPIDPKWKRDYSASVQRLVRDGVDQPLGDLFVHAARTVQAKATGVDRARSATEAFLYRRLETLENTSGKFQLNQNLPIPFCGCSSMEVDFLCTDLQLVIEIDGPQHLAETAYRTDREKDALLQQSGYFILRFLAVDIGRNLDHVLDTIHRTMAHLKHGL